MRDSPLFHGPIENFWPWPFLLPDVYFVTTRFDHRSISDEDFSRYGVPLTPDLQSAVNKRRAEFLAGRLCAHRALFILNGKGGFPATRKDRAPQWPQGCVGSITHSDTWAAALVAHQNNYLGLGLDIERRLSNTGGHKLAGGIFTAGESARLARLPPEQLGLMVTLTFSLKESLFKALYPLVGKFLYFEHIELLDWDTTAGVARLRLLCELNSEWPAGREQDAHFCQIDGHLLSLVAIPSKPLGLSEPLGLSKPSGFTDANDAT